MSSVATVAPATASPIAMLAQATWLEARHGRLLVMLAMLVLAGLCCRWFVAAMAMIESADSAISLTAPLMRLTAVVVVAAVSVSVIGRELTERRIETALSAPIARSVWVLGRFGGLAIMGVPTALAAGLPLAATDRLVSWLAWTTSLMLELWMTAALALAVTIALRRPAASLLATLVFYLCSRAIGVIDMLAASGGLTDGDAGGGPAQWFTGLLALILPRLDFFAPTGWLLDSPAAGAQALASTMGWGMLQGLAQCLLYLTLLLLVACRDVDREFD